VIEIKILDFSAHVTFNIEACEKRSHPFNGHDRCLLIRILYSSPADPPSLGLSAGRLEPPGVPLSGRFPRVLLSCENCSILP
jgi:hypothetical protein